MRIFITVIASSLLAWNAMAADGEVELPLAAKNVLSSLDRQVKSLQEKAVAELKSVMKNEAQA